MMLSDEAIADIVHGAHTRLNAQLGDGYCDPPWDALPQWHRDMITDRVRRIRAGETPEQVHWAWVDMMTGRGWVWGEVKNPSGSPPTHPSLKPLDELGETDWKKVMLAFRIVYVFTFETAPCFPDRRFMHPYQCGTSGSTEIYFPSTEEIYFPG